jgi:hypothetical protein
MINEIEEKRKYLDKAIEKLKTNGIDLAQKEKDYKIALNKKALELRNQEMPVTLINQVIFGYDDIADLRFQRDVAQATYNANQEYINSIKLQLRLLESQINREWGNS